MTGIGVLLWCFALAGGHMGPLPIRFFVYSHPTCCALVCGVSFGIFISAAEWLWLKMCTRNLFVVFAESLTSGLQFFAGPVVEVPG